MAQDKKSAVLELPESPESSRSIKDVALIWLRDMGPEVVLGIGFIMGSIVTGAVCTLAIIVALP